MDPQSHSAGEVSGGVKFACARCGKPATKKCIGCIDGPSYPKLGYTSVFYCSVDCQRVHALWHKAVCKRMKLRTKLRRIAILLKAGMLAYREVVHDMDITDIESKGGVFRYIEINHRGHNCLHRVHAPFPNDITTNPEHEEVALLFNQGTTAMHLFSRLTKKLLAGLDVTPFVAEIAIRKPRMPVRIGPGPIPEYFPHTVMFMQINWTKEFWVLDPTGAQYGIEDVFVPWKHYLDEHEGCIINEYPYPATETEDLDHFATLPEARILATKIAVERQARIVFSLFVDCLVIENLLSGPETDFTRWVGEFQERLKAHMSRYFDYREASE